MSEATATLVLRPVGAGDAGAIASLQAAAFDPPAWGEAAIRALIEAPTTHGLLLADHLGPKGYVLAQVVLDEADVLSIAVIPHARARGLGHRLLGRLVETLADDGVRRVTLEVAARNASALALYRRTGFVETGRRVGYYDGHGDLAAPDDAVTMRLDLTPPFGARST